MANTIVWDTAQIRKSGRELADMAEQMFATLSEAGKVVDETKASFDTPEGDSMRQMFDSLKTEFEKFKQDVTGFGEFVETYGLRGEELKDNVATAARKLPGANR